MPKGVVAVGVMLTLIFVIAGLAAMADPDSRVRGVLGFLLALMTFILLVRCRSSTWEGKGDVQLKKVSGTNGTVKRLAGSQVV